MSPILSTLRLLLETIALHPETVPALSRMVANIAASPNKAAAMRAAEAATAKLAIRS